MNCYYHNKHEAIISCEKCNLNLCNECRHSEHEGLCWVCGLQHNNDIITRENEISFKIPTWFNNKMVMYLLNKLAVAGVLSLSVTFLLMTYLILTGVNELSIVVLIVVYTSLIVYSYGILSSITIDVLFKLLKMRKWFISSFIYIVFGIMFPWIFKFFMGFEFILGYSSGIFTCGVASLAFFGISQLRIKKEVVFLVGFTSFVFAMLLLILVLMSSL